MCVCASSTLGQDDGGGFQGVTTPYLSPGPLMGFAQNQLEKFGVTPNLPNHPIFCIFNRRLSYLRSE